ncbi:hypothetical protein RB653_006592 [Dictyostelium firmibasis]|uniref:MARVEL domain-containing protein n=1 Tax=Dictyostelium firmibasis TaxID=79012 RepID=A0AAN7TM25_9MYCE
MSKAKLMIVLVLNIILTIAVLGFSFTQARASTNGDLNESLCDEQGVVTPIRINSGSTYAMCPWSDKQSAIRILIDALAFIAIICLIVFMFKAKRYSYVFIIVLLFIIGGFGGYSSVIDGLAIKDTKSYCDNTSFDIILEGGECQLKYFYGTVALNFGSSLFTLISSILALKYRSRIFNGDHHHHHHDEETKDDETTPIIASSNSI